MEEQNNSKVIGKVAALESQPSTIDEFYFWTKKDTLLNPFDVVVVNHIEDSKTYGVVEEISHITDSDSFLGSFISNDFGEISCPMMTDRVGMNYVRARVVENTKGILIPVHNGELVSLGSKEEIQEALGLKKMKNPVVCGYLEMYSGKVEEDKVKLPVYVNSDFLIGPEGAHLNISGISGLASKTSYAMFLLNALQQRSLKEEKAKSVAYICLNVKGRDLLTIDEPATDLPDDSKAMYKEMGLELQPFQNVKYFYPRPKNNEISASSYVRKDTYDSQVHRGQAFKYAFNYQQDKENIELLFANVEDPQQTMESIVNFIVSEQAPFNGVDDWNGMMDEISSMCEAKSKKKDDKTGSEISVMSWRKFKRIIRKSVEDNSLFVSGIKKDENEVRLEDELKKIRNNDVYVIDVAKQDEGMQAFVFGSVMRAIQNIKLGAVEGAEDVPDRIVIFVDELNKYAGADVPKSSPILQLILEIAERGRSLGIVLFAAEQFKSAIHKRVTGNCAMHAYGRTNSIEVSEKAYSFVPATYKNMMTRLKQGDYIIQNPIFNSLLKIQFPRPLYLQDKGDNH